MGMCTTENQAIRNDLFPRAGDNAARFIVLGTPYNKGELPGPGSGWGIVEF